MRCAHCHLGSSTYLSNGCCATDHAVLPLCKAANLGSCCDAVYQPPTLSCPAVPAVRPAFWRSGPHRVSLRHADAGAASRQGATRDVVVMVGRTYGRAPWSPGMVQQHSMAWHGIAPMPWSARNSVLGRGPGQAQSRGMAVESSWASRVRSLTLSLYDQPKRACCTYCTYHVCRRLLLVARCRHDADAATATAAAAHRHACTRSLTHSLTHSPHLILPSLACADGTTAIRRDEGRRGARQGTVFSIWIDIIHRGSITRVSYSQSGAQIDGKTSSLRRGTKDVRKHISMSPKRQPNSRGLLT